MQFLEVSQTRNRIQQMMEGIKKQARLGAEAGLRRKMPDATTEQLARVDAIADSMIDVFSVDEMIDALIPIYQKHLSKSDIDGILAFYASPAGQRLLKETPAIMAESMEVGGELGRKKLGDVNARIEEQMKAMIAEEQAKRAKEQVRQPAKD
jgi:hypothetical protein